MPKGVNKVKDGKLMNIILSGFENIPEGTPVYLKNTVIGNIVKGKLHLGMSNLLFVQSHTFPYDEKRKRITIKNKAEENKKEKG